MPQLERLQFCGIKPVEPRIRVMSYRLIFIGCPGRSSRPSMKSRYCMMASAQCFRRGPCRTHGCRGGSEPLSHRRPWAPQCCVCNSHVSIRGQQSNQGWEVVIFRLQESHQLDGQFADSPSVSRSTGEATRYFCCVRTAHAAASPLRDSQSCHAQGNTYRRIRLLEFCSTRMSIGINGRPVEFSLATSATLRTVWEG